MPNEERKHKFVKGEWDAKLKERAEALYNLVEGITSPDDAISEILAQLKYVGLQSWKNGLAVGAREATKKQKTDA